MDSGDQAQGSPTLRTLTLCRAEGSNSDPRTFRGVFVIAPDALGRSSRYLTYSVLVECLQDHHPLG